MYQNVFKRLLSLRNFGILKIRTGQMSFFLNDSLVSITIRIFKILVFLAQYFNVRIKMTGIWLMILCRVQLFQSNLGKSCVELYDNLVTVLSISQVVFNNIQSSLYVLLGRCVLMSVGLHLGKSLTCIGIFDRLWWKLLFRGIQGRFSSLDGLWILTWRWKGLCQQIKRKEFFKVVELTSKLLLDGNRLIEYFGSSRAIFKRKMRLSQQSHKQRVKIPDIYA